MRYRLLVVAMLLLAWRSGARAGPGATEGREQRTDTSVVGPASSGAREAVRRWLGHDLRLTTGSLLSQKAGARQQVLVCRGGFTLEAAGSRFTGDSAVVRIDASEPNDPDAPRYTVLVYLKDPDLQAPTGSLEELGLEGALVEEGQAAVLRLPIEGEVYVTADSMQTGSPQGLLLYREALEAFDATGFGAPPDEGPQSQSSPTATAPETADETTGGYTIGVAPLTDATQYERTESEAGEVVTTLIGRVYIRWQEQDAATGRPLVVELEADNLVYWQHAGDVNVPLSELMAAEQTDVSAVYVAGDVRLTEGPRTIRASEFYYDLRRRRGVAKEGVLSTFDAARGIPIYVRASELKLLAANEYAATDVSVTASEFRTPQVSLSAGRIHVIDRTEGPPAGARSSDNRFDATMEDVRLKFYDTTLFAWPSLRSDLQRPDVPIRGIRVGSDSTYGTSVETSWFFSRLLGLQEPEGTDSTLHVDYYGKRGVGVGVDIAYERDTYFGRVLGYIINDNGEDRLSRTQLSVPVPQDMRGRFEFQHRHFLPYGWQLTAEASYLSDRNFLEQYYRSEFNAGKEQETLLHLKRIEDNWGLAVLGKTRVNDFLDQVEEMPSGEFHWTGQSLFGDSFTFYSDTQASRYRYRYRSDSTPGEPEGFFTYTMTRNELDAPLRFGRSKVVPFVAATFGYEDGAGFQAALDGTSLERKDLVTIGEAGVRASTQPFWKVYSNVKSKFWDLDQLRHVIRPEITAVTYTDSDPVVRQRDTLDVGIYQRWQTKRGPADRRRTVDWLRWNVDFVWVNDSGDATAGPDQFLWNQPFIPLANRTAMALPPQDRRTTGMFGPQRNYIGTDLALRLTDTTSVLGDLNFDMQSGVVQQVNVGFSRLCWPNLSYYIGSRYLRRIVSGAERGSNAVTFAATYVLDPRYTLVFSEQYDFDYGAGIQSDITLVRRYHRMNLALTLSSDESLDEERIVLSLWPQGVPELGLGMRRYMELGATEAY
ncbi:MAG: hypothetical protein JW993_00620 [Sedimentisphaerales bacterium]|nr:hypothetical protein [Sedimentisphaerales bacterium]